ncbi:RDD family protein [Spirulina subsalsa]|uniref:RDD family protein n=1 Tax=Spirulina subsalsa TaxID=54311 RepID=UPI0002F668E0|nr:RDD family protein [Spirulina subsalsa]
MTSDRPVPKRFPKVPFERRFYGFLIDFVCVWVISSLAGPPLLQMLVFLGAWFTLRVVVVDRNGGQSLGSWCMDIKVMDVRFRKVPELFILLKREALLGGAALLAMIGLNLFFVNPFSTLLLVSPLVAGCGVAYADEDYNQGLHDRLCNTVVIQTKRGFSLDIRLRRWLAEVRFRMRK